MTPPTVRTRPGVWTWARPAGGVDADDDGCGEDGDCDGDRDADGDADADGEDVETAPVHAVPLSAKSVGAGLDPVQEPLNPSAVLAPLPRLPFQAALTTLTCAPDWLAVPFQSCVMLCPAANDHVSFHP